MTPSRMPIIAIIGPLRAHWCWQRWRNMRRASGYALQVWKLGAIAYCPHTSSGCLSGTLDESVWLAGHQQMLQHCDAALAMPGWRYSVGSSREVVEMGRLGKPVFESFDQLQSWMSTWSASHAE